MKKSSAISPIRANLLGDVRAEVDREMLDQAFYESPDYRTLIESLDRCVVVGRRGTGKSALAYKLNSHFSRADESVVIQIAPDEDEIIGFRPIAQLFGPQFRTMRAGATIAWRYGLFLEIADRLRVRTKVKRLPAFAVLERHLDRWRASAVPFTVRLRRIVRSVMQGGAHPEELVGDLAHQLEIKEVEVSLQTVLRESAIGVVCLLDRLDEGYEPDDIGIGLVDGLIQAAIDVKVKLPAVRPIVFLRDNVYRAVAKLDPDFSRNIEGQTLRLHWDEYTLLNLTANRLRAAIGVDQEQSIRVWDRCSDSTLQGREGFRRCLRLTLYRPRDLLILLNNAFLNAAQQSRERIVPEDIDVSAQSISVHRLEDLRKEYTRILPSLTVLTEAFANSSPELTVAQASQLIEPILVREDLPHDVQQYFAISSTAAACLRDLFSVGFLGIREATSGNFIFCHDGREPNREFSADDRLLVHPCYWMGLNIANKELAPDAAQEIYDEYEINVSSETPKRRAAEIGRIIAEEGTIPPGRDGWVQFEDWAFRAVKVIFAGRLSNIQLHPNKDATQRRDIVARNLANSDYWKRVLDDYGTRQAVFEVKNYETLTDDDFRQALSYSTGEYGRCVFFITRAVNDNLQRGPELDWVRSLYYEHKRLVIKLSSRMLCTLLGKLRSPQKHDAADKHMDGLTDQYVRLYLNLPKSKNGRK